MVYPYIYKKNLKKGQRVAIEGAVLEETKDGKFLIGFYPDTKANLLEINGDRVYPIKKKEFLLQKDCFIIRKVLQLYRFE